MPLPWKPANNNNATLTNFALSGNSSNWMSHSLTVLPVRFLSFTARKQSNSIQLNWSTAQEQNSSSFEIQRSSDGNHFMRIGNIAAAGNSDHLLNYRFTDMAPLSGDNYYRLKQIDADGRYIYSSIVKEATSSPTNLKLQGNPVQEALKAIFSGTTNGRLQLVITGVSGEILIEKYIAVKPGANEINIPLYKLKPGLYYLQASSGNWKKVLKFSRLP